MSVEESIKDLIRDEISGFDLSDKVSEEFDNLDITDKVVSAVDGIDLTETVSKLVDDLDITENVANAIGDYDFSDVVSEELGKIELGDVLNDTISEKIDEQFDDFCAYNKRFDRKLDAAIEGYMQTEQFEKRLKELIVEAFAEIPTAEVLPTPQEIQDDNARMFEELFFEEVEQERKKSWLDNENDLNAAWQDAAM